MKYKAILLDIDDTLYSYDRAHFFAKKSITNFFKKKFKIENFFFTSTYEEARKKVHLELIIPSSIGLLFLLVSYIRYNSCTYKFPISWNN